LTGALPAGANTIGGVSLIGPLASLTGALPAGSNTIGGVSLIGPLASITGAFPAGTNTIGGVSLIGPLASLTGALPAGSNTIGGVSLIGPIVTPIVKEMNGSFFGPYDLTLIHMADATYGAALTPTPVATAQAATKVDIQGRATNIGNAYGAFALYAGAVTTLYPLAPQQSVPFSWYDNVGNIAVSFGIQAVNGGSTTGVTVYVNEVYFRKE
jgi:hypothetical protein